MVIFTSLRPLERSENIKTVWDAYDGKKIFVRSDREDGKKSLKHRKADLVITDEFISESASPIIMIFHAVAGGKTYGLDQPRPYHNLKNNWKYLYFITSSEYMVDMVAKQCGVSKEKVLPIGVPRTDQYFVDLERDTDLMPADKKIYLYVPTFKTLTEALTDWHKIDTLLNDDEMLIIKNHMITGDPHLKNDNMFKHIKIVSCNFQSIPFLKGCDVVITDYSSIMFDAYILRKPVVLYEKDWKLYKKDRGMYFDYPLGYSLRHTTDEEELVEIIRDAAEGTWVDRVCESNREKFAGACDGHSTERLIDLIKQIERSKK